VYHYEATPQMLQSSFAPFKAAAGCIAQFCSDVFAYLTPKYAYPVSLFDNNKIEGQNLVVQSVGLCSCAVCFKPLVAFVIFELAFTTFLNCFCTQGYTYLWLEQKKRYCI